MAIDASPPKGTRDFLPAELGRREATVQVIRTAFERHGFVPLETPAIERIETLSGKYGEEGERLIFRILKRGDKLDRATRGSVNELADLGLRYDLTVPLARVVAEHHAELPKYFKRYQIQPVWRADRPQKGRYREFHQCDVDYVGSESLICEVEVISAVSSALFDLGFDNFRLRMNDRRILSGIMAAAAVPVSRQTEALVALDKLDKIGAEGVASELAALGLTRAGTSVLEAVMRRQEAIGAEASIAAVEEMTAIIGQASEVGMAGCASLRELLGLVASIDRLRPILAFDPSLARGLSYYTGAIFEVVLPDSTGSLCGGGRYDNLIGMFLGRQIPAVGFSMGLDRIVNAIERRGGFPPPRSGASVVVAQADASMARDTLRLATLLRSAGISAEVFPTALRLGQQMKHAETIGASFVVVPGAREARAGQVLLKDITTGEQTIVSLDALVGEIRSKLKGL